MDNGYISIHRKIRDCFVWDKDNPKLLMAWLDILMMANWKPKQKVIKGKVVEIPRGSFVTSYVKLAERWGVHRDTAKRWMKLFEAEKMVKIRSNNSYTYVTVENYSSYQTTDSDDTTAETSAEATQLNKDNNNNKKKNNKKEKVDEVEAFIAKCPEEMHECLKEFAKMRKTIKKPLTAYALQRACTKAKNLANGDIPTMIAIFDQSTERSYQGVFPLAEENKPKPQESIFSDDIYDMIDA